MALDGASVNYSCFGVWGVVCYFDVRSLGVEPFRW